MLRGGSTGKGPDSASLKLKVAARCGDPKLLADAMKSDPGVEDLNTKTHGSNELKFLHEPHKLPIS